MGKLLVAGFPFHPRAVLGTGVDLRRSLQGCLHLRWGRALACCLQTARGASSALRWQLRWENICIFGFHTQEALAGLLLALGGRQPGLLRPFGPQACISTSACMPLPSQRHIPENRVSEEESLSLRRGVSFRLFCSASQ